MENSQKNYDGTGNYFIFYAAYSIYAFLACCSLDVHAQLYLFSPF